MTRRADLNRLYELLTALEERVGGKRLLSDCTGHMNWPARGVYVFFAPDEQRASGEHLRVTRVGTHAVSTDSKTSLWDRLRAHRGTLSGAYAGGGNHRGSVFRKQVGEALIEQGNLHAEYPEWGTGSSAGCALRLNELPLERRVSNYIRDLPFLWIHVDDVPASDSIRAYIERNAIALLSNFEKDAIDPRSADWLGRDSPREEIHDSGLWNINHVDEDYDPAFLDRLQEHIEMTTELSDTV